MFTLRNFVLLSCVLFVQVSSDTTDTDDTPYCKFHRNETSCSIYDEDSKLQCAKKISYALAQPTVDCPSSTVLEVCDREACAAQCTDLTSDWSSWSSCPKSCAGESSMQMSTRSARNGKNGDLVKACVLVIRRQCFGTEPCPVATTETHDNCDAYQWTTWSSCSLTCSWSAASGAEQVRSRVGHVEHDCPRMEWRQCPHLPKCGRSSLRTSPWPCDKQSVWTNWAPCIDTKCAPGEQFRRQQGNPLCRAYETRICSNGDGCSIDDCPQLTWSPWSECSETCLVDEKKLPVQFRSRSAQPAFGNCSLAQQRRCQGLSSCPLQDFDQAGYWSTWSQCSATCQVGTSAQQTRERIFLPGGEHCSNRLDTRSCLDVEQCQTEKECHDLSDWSAWSTCPASCISRGLSEPMQFRSRAPEAGLEHCELSQKKLCADQLDECPIDQAKVAESLPNQGDDYGAQEMAARHPFDEQPQVKDEQVPNMDNSVVSSSTWMVVGAVVVVGAVCLSAGVGTFILVNRVLDKIETRA